MRSLSGPRMITGRVYSMCNRWTDSYDKTFSSDAIELYIEREEKRMQNDDQLVDLCNIY